MVKKAYIWAQVTMLFKFLDFAKFHFLNRLCKLHVLKDLGGQKSEIWAQIDFATFHVLKDRGDQK